MTSQNPQVHYASDMDGVRYAMITSEQADMKGWQILAQDRSGDEVARPFSLGTAWRDGAGNPRLAYVNGPEVQVWQAIVDHNERGIVLIAPDGEQHSLHLA